MDLIVRQDIIDLENVRAISSVETLIQLLRKRVGSPISYSSLAQDLRCSDKTVKSWLTLLENMYIIFRVSPYHKNIARALLRAPKYYFYDTGQVVGDEGVKLENLSASALLKEIHYREDCFGERYDLFDAVVDLRISSSTFGHAFTMELEAETGRQLYMPPGFAHGFLVLSEYAEFLYKTTDYYAPAFERSLRWNDPALAIDWPLDREPQLSAKDQAALPLAECEVFA